MKSTKEDRRFDETAEVSLRGKERIEKCILYFAVLKMLRGSNSERVVSSTTDQDSRGSAVNIRVMRGRVNGQSAAARQK